MGKILLVYASFGEGHKRAALALEKYLNAIAVDFLDFSSKSTKKFFSYSYFFVTQKVPFLWKILFYGTKNKYLQKIVKKINFLLANRFFKYILELKPTTIITTHFFPLYFIDALKKKLSNLRVITVVTDFGVHPLWISNSVDLYFVLAKETKESLMEFGVEEKKIIYGYVPLRDGFFTDFAENSLREKFILDKKPCILFILSLQDRLSMIKDAVDFLRNDFNLFIICGRNKRVQKYLKNLNYSNLKIFTFYEEIWELFYISSIIITKPGGLTVFEGIHMKKPFIFMNYIPGQEEENMQILINYGLAKFVKNKNGFINAVNYFKSISNSLKINYPIQLKDIRLILKNFIV